MIKKIVSLKKVFIPVVLCFGMNVSASDVLSFSYIGAKIGSLQLPDYTKESFKKNQSVSYGVESFYLMGKDKGVAFGLNASYTAANFEGKPYYDGSSIKVKWTDTSIGALVGSISIKNNMKKAWFIGYELHNTQIKLDTGFSLGNAETTSGGGYIVGYTTSKVGGGLGFQFALRTIESALDQGRIYEAFGSVGYSF